MKVRPERRLGDGKLFTAYCLEKTVGYGTEGKKQSHPTPTGMCVGVRHRCGDCLCPTQPTLHAHHIAGRGWQPQLPGSESACLGQRAGKGLTCLGLSHLVGPPGSQPCRKQDEAAV